MELLSTMEERGMAKNCRQNILDLLQVRFLSVPETLVEILNNIEDLAFLKQLLLETIRVNSVAEFEELIKMTDTRANYDEPWKAAIGEYFQSFLSFFYPEIHNSINWEKTPISLDKELEKITASAITKKHYAEKLFKVWLLDDQEIWILIHIEVYSEEEEEFTRRVFIYNYRAFDLCDKTVISLAILGDDSPYWRPSSYKHKFKKSRMKLDFDIVKLLDYKWEELLASNNVFATMVMAHLRTKSTTRDFTEREKWKWQLVRSLYEKGLSKFDIINLFKFIDKMMALPPTLQQNLEIKINQYEEEQKIELLSTME